MKEYVAGGPPDFSRECWFKEKFTLGFDFPNLPFIIDTTSEKEVKLTETAAIMKYIASKWSSDLLGTTPSEIGQVEMLLNVLSNLQLELWNDCYYVGDRVAVVEKTLEKVKQIVGFLGEKEFLLGKKMTYVDFILFEICDWMEWCTEGKSYSEQPSLKAYHDRMTNVKGVAEFYADEERCFKKPFHNLNAKLNNA